MLAMQEKFWYDGRSKTTEVPMKYRCLVLDHDDTVVRSAQTVNYPALIESLHRTHPDRDISFEEFTRMCFLHNFTGMCRLSLGLTDAETQGQFEDWKVYVRTHIPPAYEGFDRLLHRWRAAGGLVCVSSHSSVENITRDFRANFDFLPDQIYSFELPPEQRKPAPFALLDIMRRYHLRPDELLMVDDMKNGNDMAHAAGVDFAAAGWSHTDPMIVDYMRQNSDRYFTSVAELEAYLFDGLPA